MEVEEIKFAIVSVGGNCNRFLSAWHNSICCQDNHAWKCYAQLDPSVDGSRETLDELTKYDPRFDVVFNDEPKWCLRNTVECVRRVKDDDAVIVCLDLDDSFYDKAVLNLLFLHYVLSETWMTYGSYVTSDDKRAHWCREIPDKVWEDNSHRRNIWSTSALRSFRKWLFDEIDPADFLMPDGSWPKRATDRFFMYPMLEMAGRDHVVFVKQTLYYVNVYGQQSEMNSEEQHALKHVLGMEPYRTLKGRPR